MASKRRYKTDPELLLAQGKAIVDAGDEVRYQHKVEMVNLVLGGLTPSFLAEHCGDSKNSITGWVKAADERGFEADGVWYHHILDPATGWPVQNELASVTIFSESSMLGDALATAAFALGGEAGAALIEGIDGVEAVFIARDRSARYTSGADAYMEY